MNEVPFYDDGPFDWMCTCKKCYNDAGRADHFNDAWHNVMMFKLRHEIHGCKSQNIHRIIINRYGNIIWPAEAVTK